MPVFMCPLQHTNAWISADIQAMPKTFLHLHCRAKVDNRVGPNAPWKVSIPARAPLGINYHTCVAVPMPRGLYISLIIVCMGLDGWMGGQTDGRIACLCVFMCVFVVVCESADMNVTVVAC